jgi:hypothetical protein
VNRLLAGSPDPSWKKASSSHTNDGPSHKKKPSFQQEQPFLLAKSPSVPARRAMRSRKKLDGVSSAVLTMKHDFGQSVLLTYAVSKKLVKVREHADLLPFVANMRNANRLGRSRKTLGQS